jgi:replicative DNA helicase
MDVQRHLLSKLIHDQAISVAVAGKITPEFFTDDRYRRVYEYLVEHWRTYGQPADIEVMRDKFPSHEWPTSPMPLAFFLDGLRQRRKRALGTEMLTQAITLLNATDEPSSLDSMFDVIKHGLQQVASETNPALDSDLTGQRGALMDVVEERRSDPGYLRGIPTGFNGIDYVTGGLQPEQFVVLIGLPKAFKSATLLAMAKNIHSSGRVPLFIGFEMSNQEQHDRLMSLYGEVSLTGILNGTINNREYKAIDKALRRLESGRSFITSADLSGMTISGLQAKIMDYRPDVVLVDALYLMRSETPKIEQGSAQALTEIARGLKELAQSQSIPIIGTTQATMTRSKGGLNMFSPMYTQAFGQSADVLLGVERVDEEESDKSAVTIRMKVLASRSGPRAETILRWDWSRGAVTELPPADFNREDRHELN